MLYFCYGYSMQFRAICGKGIALSVLCWLACSSSVSAQTLETSLSMTSEPGDFIGQGQSYLYAQADGTFTVQKNFYNGVTVSFSTPDYSHWWSLDFAAPNNQFLAVGTYLGGVRYPFQDADQSGLAVAGDGRGCNTLTGRFEVKQIEYGAGAAITAFWATFEQHCEGGVPALFGEIRYSADVGLVVTAPYNQTIGRLQPLTFNVSAVDLAGHSVTLSAIGLPEGATFTDQGDNTGVLTWTPAMDQLGRYLVTFRGDDGHGGTNTSATLVSVMGVTALAMQSDSGDYIGGGQSYLYTPSNAWILAGTNYDNGVSASSIVPDYSHWWSLDFAAPNNEPLAVETYLGAMRYPFQDADKPGLDLYGDGRGCNTLTGQFEVKQIEYGTGTDIAAFWATIEQHCEGATPALHGEILYNADARLDIVVPGSASIFAGRMLTIPVSVPDPQGLPVTMTAVDLPSGAVFTDHGDNTATLEWTPGADQAGDYTVNFNAADGLRYAGSATTHITVTLSVDLTGSWLTLERDCSARGNRHTDHHCALRGIFQLENLGAGAAGSTATRFYLSDDPSWGSGDQLIGQQLSGGLQAGATEQIRLGVHHPRALMTSGRYVIAVVDAADNQMESDETNNVIVYGPMP